MVTAEAVIIQILSKQLVDLTKKKKTNQELRVFLLTNLGDSKLSFFR